jgi:DNA-binding PadR family transcriptional regulator
MTSKLSPTAYALLGLLDRRPFSAYELTKYMKRSALAWLWPRTEAGIYRAPKQLLERGLATMTTEGTGRRTRTVYAITPAGREALAAWLREPGGPFLVECESAVKAFFGDSADVETLRGHLRRIGEHQPHRLEPSPAAAMEEWLEGRMAFPDRVQYTAMTADLITRVEHTVSDWAEHWLALVDVWEDTSLTPTSEAQARTELERMVAVRRERERRSQNQRPKSVALADA